MKQIIVLIATIALGLSLSASVADLQDAPDTALGSAKTAIESLVVTTPSGGGV